MRKLTLNLTLNHKLLLSSFMLLNNLVLRLVKMYPLIYFLQSKVFGMLYLFQLVAFHLK